MANLNAPNNPNHFEGMRTTHVPYNQFAYILWRGNNPRLIVYRIGRSYDIDQHEREVNLRYYRVQVEDYPVDDEKREMFLINIDDLPMIDVGDPRLNRFYSESLDPNYVVGIRGY